jgi:hypothetical protein
VRAILETAADASTITDENGIIESAKGSQCARSVI